MVVMAAILDASLTPSTNRVGYMYQWLKSILSTIAT
jgi:hypothetical protein